MAIYYEYKKTVIIQYNYGFYFMLCYVNALSL